MVWWTPSGERILEGAEAVLFAETLLDLIDEVNLGDENDYDLGVDVFDSLSATRWGKSKTCPILGIDVLQQRSLGYVRRRRIKASPPRLSNTIVAGSGTIPNLPCR